MKLSLLYVTGICYSIFLTLTPCSAECGLKVKNDQHSKDLLKKLEPLKGSSFKYTYHYTDEKNVEHSYDYTLSICAPVSVQGFNADHAGVLQQETKEDSGAPIQQNKIIGLVNSTIIKGGTDWLMLTYTHGDEYNSHCYTDKNKKSRRQAHVMIVCDPAQLKGQFSVLYEHNSDDHEEGCFYMMELSSNVACTEGGLHARATTAQKGLSAGSIFLIVFFTLSLSYLMVGAIYKRCVYGSKGWEQVPNIAFWKTCGSLQADGCNYLCRCQESGYSSNQPYRGIADDQLEDEMDDENLLPM